MQICGMTSDWVKGGRTTFYPVQPCRAAFYPVGPGRILPITVSLHVQNRPNNLEDEAMYTVEKAQKSTDLKVDKTMAAVKDELTKWDDR